MAVLQTVVHYSMHFLVPGAIAWVLFRPGWRSAWWVMVCTMAVDLDHLWAYPEIFAANRCSIGFHPLHSSFAIGVYVLLLLWPRARVVATGLLFHMLTDAQDCLWM